MTLKGLTFSQTLLTLKTRPKGTNIALGNDGIKENLKDILIRNEKLRKQSVAFYHQISRLTPTAKKPSDSYRFWEKTDVDVYQIALNVTKTQENPRGSKTQALRIMSVFGHNDVLEFFNVTPDLLNKYYGDIPNHADILKEFKALNLMRPDRSSPFYAPGSIGGLNIPNSYIQQMKKYHDELSDLIDRWPEKEIVPTSRKEEYLEKIFRSGYYHFVGGTYTASEFLIHGFGTFWGINLPNTFSYLLGHYYKKITMVNTYLPKRAKFLYQKMGITKIKNLSPEKIHSLLIEVNRLLPENEAKWDMVDLQVAKLMLDINLLHLDISTYQHLESSDWAFRQIVEESR